ncbi:MAG: hypothetical protein NXY57DRAFT_968599 [Lentinula lateritia]|nr:MAG: hypothetical protein NXY57DRAFT_968599 [Lentinula lateritia]
MGIEALRQAIILALPDDLSSVVVPQFSYRLRFPFDFSPSLKSSGSLPRSSLYCLWTYTFSGPLLVTGNTAAPTWLLLVSLLTTSDLRGLTA